MTRLLFTAFVTLVFSALSARAGGAGGVAEIVAAAKKEREAEWRRGETFTQDGEVVVLNKHVLGAHNGRPDRSLVLSFLDANGESKEPFIEAITVPKWPNKGYKAGQWAPDAGRGRPISRGQRAGGRRFSAVLGG